MSMVVVAMVKRSARQRTALKQKLQSGHQNFNANTCANRNTEGVPVHETESSRLTVLHAQSLSVKMWNWKAK